MFMFAAALETKKGKAAFQNAFHQVVEQTAIHSNFVLDFQFSVADPCLQIADYFAWAVQRRWESNKIDFYRHVKPFIRSEFDLWRRGTTLYYE
jgi:hypothetical protein